MLAATRLILHFIGGKLREYQPQTYYDVRLELYLYENSGPLHNARPVFGKTLTFPRNDSISEALDAFIGGMCVIASLQMNMKALPDKTMISVAVSHPDLNIKWSETRMFSLFQP